MNTLLALEMGATIGVGLVIGLAVAAVVFGLVFLLCVLPDMKKGKNKEVGQPVTEEAEEAEEEHALEVLEEEIEEEAAEEAAAEQAEEPVEETVEEVADEQPAEEPVEETVEEVVEEQPAEEPAEEPVEEVVEEQPVEESVQEQPVEEKAKKEAAATAVAEEAEEEDEEEEDDDVEDNESDEEKVERLAAIGSAPELEVNQRYNRSFKARVIQSSDAIKGWYSQIKNAALSYKGTRSSLSWRQEKIYKGRAQFLKIAIRGKTLCVYFPLSVSDVKNIEVEDVSDKSVHANTPALLRIKKEVHVQQALTLISQSAQALALENGKPHNTDYVKEYKLETTEKLIEEGLVKVVTFKK